MTKNKNNRDFELEDFFNAAKQTAPEVSETLRRKILDASEQGHKVDEFITKQQLFACDEFLSKLLA